MKFIKGIRFLVKGFELFKHQTWILCEKRGKKFEIHCKSIFHSKTMGQTGWRLNFAFEIAYTKNKLFQLKKSVLQADLQILSW